MVRLIQSIALTLNKHYPARLHRLFLVETPRVVHWPIQARPWTAPYRGPETCPNSRCLSERRHVARVLERRLNYAEGSSFSLLPCIQMLCPSTASW